MQPNGRSINRWMIYVYVYQKWYIKDYILAMNKLTLDVKK
jgi:hypothetical protein